MKPAAVLWDESFLWGIMARKALVENDLAFDLIRAEDVRKGTLKNYRMLFVPGGWASNKVKALGDRGIEAIKRFVHDGGAYLGFCGGAGLATMEGIGLLAVTRRPTKERVPSFSGPIRLSPCEHPLWKGIATPLFHAWWPSQFILVDDTVSVLAAYSKAMPGAFSSDINVGDAETAGNWSDLEKLYGINLDPSRLLGEPAVIEGTFGSGRVLLSLVHFDTPGDFAGSKVLRNIWDYFEAQRAGAAMPEVKTDNPAPGPVKNRQSTPDAADTIATMLSAVAELIDLGHRNFLWHWRSPMLLQWRRGVRGLEYCTLFIMVKEIAESLKRIGNADTVTIKDSDERIDRMARLLYLFTEKAKFLIVRERFAIQTSNITYERCDDPEIQRLREELFSLSKSHGGLFKNLADELDSFLYALLSLESSPPVIGMNMQRCFFGAVDITRDRERK